MASDPKKSVGTERLVEIFVNPLAFLEVDEPWASATPATVTPELVLAYLTAPGLGHDVPSVVERYREISKETPRLFAAPAEQRILDKLVWPLRHAKASYVLGNYLGAISLCGMVAEMLAIVLFETADVRLNGSPMGEDSQKLVFGSSFEKLGQDRRVSVLRVHGIIDDTTANAFDRLRLIRRKYLHLWSQDHDALPRDAVEAFLAAAQLVVTVIGHSIGEGGRIRLTPAMDRYLSRVGTARPDDT